VGKKFRVVHCLGAADSFKSAILKVKGTKSSKFTNIMIHQIDRLADGHKMTKENFPKEGKLPSKGGNSKNFNALKKIPIRGYCWLSDRYPNTYFISHYIYKDFDKLSDTDTKRVCNNWKRIEENGHER
jgi:hypothetical protein